jgi:FkbM family methyltransferase
MVDDLRRNKERLTWLGSRWGGLHIDLDLIPAGGLVISAGLASDITFDVSLIERKGCTVIGVDPTSQSEKTVRRFVRRNSRWRRNFRLIRKAVHGRTGLTIRLGGVANTSLAPDGEEAETISLDDLHLTYSGAALLKLDIEGAEFPAIQELSSRLIVPQIAIGFHAWLNGESDQYPTPGVPPGLYTKHHVMEAIQKIKGMGYKLVYEGREVEDRIGQETLFIRPVVAPAMRRLTPDGLPELARDGAKNSIGGE